MVSAESRSRSHRWAGAAWHASDLGTADSQSVPIDREEPGGTAVVESLALGTPVVGYRRGCLPELVEHGRIGFLVGPGDEDAPGDTVRRSGEIDPQDCRRVAAARFTPAHTADRYLRLYDRVLERSGRAVRLRAAVDI